jgi:hypothetical protein
MNTEKMSLQDKKRKLRKLKSLLNTAHTISNDLIWEETHTVLTNSYHLQQLNKALYTCKTRVGFIEYKD